MKNILLFVFILFCGFLFAQQDSSIQKIPTQYRRGIELQNGYQFYSQKHSGKNLDEEKRRLFPLQSTGIWTELNPKVPRVDYLGIHFVNVDTGWAVGDLGALIKTTNGGTDWETIETNTTTPILKVNSYNGQTVIASGFNGLILRSTDGGETFTEITSDVTGDLWGLQMINDTLGWSCGTSSSLIKTTDGGLTWQTVTTPGYTGNKWWINFRTENYGFIAGDGKVLRTTNGGNNWDIIQAGDNQALYSVDVIDSLHIAAAGYGGTGYLGKNIYSNDGGNTWINGGEVTTDPINCIKYINPDTGYFVMSEVGLWKTTNSGQYWKLLDSIPLTNIGEFEIQLFKPQNIGYDAGSSLKIYKADGTLDNWHKLIINDDFADVFFTSEQKGFVISSGPRGRVYRTFDSGELWQLAPGPSGYSLLFTDSLTGYLGSTSVWKTSDGGDSWYETNSPNTFGGVSKIFFINHQTGWYVTMGGAIFKSTDYGEDWLQQLNVYPDEVSSIYFIDSLYGWANSRYLWQTTDGGNDWIQRNDLQILFSSDVYFINIDTGWVAGYLASPFYNALHKTSDGGLNWTIVSEVIGPSNFNFFPDPIHWIINGSQHTYITIDSGNTWNEITNDIPAGFNRFQAPTDFVGYAAGSGGLILKYNDTTFTPVELASFNGKLENDKVLLTWITASELNNYGFYIEKSVDKINWKEIGFVKGKGTTTTSNNYIFIDPQSITNETYYRLKQQDFSGLIKYSYIISVKTNYLPLVFRLYQNYPNPFNPNTKISYEVPKSEFVQLKVFNIMGQEITELVNEKQEAGKYTVVFPGGLLNKNLPSGIYIYQLKSGEKTISRKMLLIK